MRSSQLLTGILFILLTCNLSAQKVGVNKPNPQATLDVGGSINLDSNITIKGIPGQEGQFLMAMGDNKMAWQNINVPGSDQFKYWRYYLGNASFIIPDGVTRILVEAWGGGGGGTFNIGGGSGGYAASYFNVSPGQEVVMTIGAGGTGATGEFGNSGDGGNTIVTVLSNSITAQGGKGIQYNTQSIFLAKAIGGDGGGYSFAGPDTRTRYGTIGLRGKPTTQSDKNMYYGAGGDAPMWPAPSGGAPAYFMGNSLLYDIHVTGSTGNRPGGGGGSKLDPLAPEESSREGLGGGPGMVRIGY